ncbi:MAG: DUF952 domain-containing protein [Anaerolineae bacterium]|nr:MAG: DUF952 domain-containing protein [Anaerolineae bacterium]
MYHICTRAAWQKALENSEYRPESLEREGFIHFSERHELLNVANAFYRGQGDLVVLIVETERLKAELCYEPPLHPRHVDFPVSNTALFPHLYGALNLDAVIDTIEFIPDKNGWFSFSSF